MMTEEQRYLFDLYGFLHLKNALTPEELDAASEAVRRYIGSAPEDYGFESARYEVRQGRIYCDDFVVFPYLDDVHPGDGGLLVVPGSHKSQFDRPPQLFSQVLIEGEVPPGVINITPAAGDVVVMPECLTHGVLPWRAADRQRRVLTLRYRPHHRQAGPIPAEVKERLAPETRELLETAHYTHEKEIATRQRVCLSQ